jgi:Fe-S-cluster containining protein
MDNKTKVERFVLALIPNDREVRSGSCTPESCETLDGVKGNACCKLGGECVLLKKDACSFYALRPINCRTFPRSSDDLKLVKNCGYKFDKL